MSISRKYGRLLAAGVTVLGLLVGFTLPAMGAPIACSRVLGSPAATAGPLRTLGVESAIATLNLAAGHSYLIEVTERDNDPLAKPEDPAGKSQDSV